MSELWAQDGSQHTSGLDQPADIERLLVESPKALLLAERNREVVGAVVAGWDGWRGNIYRLAVRADCRRNGIGIVLIRAGEDYLRECGARRITALVASDDERAGASWEAAGYPQDDGMGRRARNL